MSLDKHPLVSDWLSVRDGHLVVRTGKVDIGQRISSALAWIAHEELTIPLDLIEVAPVTTAGSPEEGMTSGSNSIEQSGRAVRLASATLRALAVGLAAERAGGDPADWHVEDGALAGPGSNRPLAMVTLLADCDLAVPVDELASVQAAAKALPAVPMRGMSDLVTGRYRFVHDLEVPGMLHARVVRPPHLRSRLTGVSEDRLRSLEEGGIRVIRDGSFLAVAGDREWPVEQAARRLAGACSWDDGGGLPEADVFASLIRENAVRLRVEDGTPREGAIPDPVRDPSLAARYERPFIMHGALAPSAALATWTGGCLRIVTHSQGIYPLRQSIAESLGLPPEALIIEHAPGSGCYGHNGADDAAFEAALIALALPDRPVLLKWTREQEHAWEPYGTAMAVEIAARNGPGNKIEAISVEAIGGTFRGRPRAGPNRSGPAKLVANRFRADPFPAQPPVPNLNRQGGLHRNLDAIYAVPDTRCVKNLVTDLPHRTSAIRCLGAAANVFAIESFMEEMAHKIGEDPLSFRRRHLKDPRAVAVLDRLGEAAARLPEIAGAGRGFAYAQYKNEMTRVGIALDVSVTDAAELRLLRAVIVADAGRVVDRDGLEAQLQGGFMQAASWALHEEVTWGRDGILSTDWDTYPVLRFDNVPDIQTLLVDRQEEKSLGAGEASPGPTLAAIANALFDATGIRMRRLPFTADAISRAALRD